MSTYQEYAKWGWPTFPVAGPVYASNKDDYKTWKAPLVDTWKPYQDRLPTAEEIASWEKRWPLAWIGGTTGPFSNIFVIDIDGEKGINSLKELAIPMPITKVAKTQRGHHYFFRWSKRMENIVTSKNGILPGIDIKGKGGFVILPSFHSKRSWACEEFCAELPEAWYSHLLKSSSLKRPAGWRKEALENLNDGNRHDTFMRLTSSLLHARWSKADILMVLRPFADQQKFSNDLEELVDDMIRRYSPEGRLIIIQERTRKAVSAMPIITADHLNTLKKTHPDLIASAFKAQDAYDREAVRWLSLDKMWEQSDAERALSEWGMCVCNLSTSL